MATQDKATAADKAAEKAAQEEMERNLAIREQEIDRDPTLNDDQKKEAKEQARGTKGTPPGAGRAYEERPSGTANTNGKASATRAGGDPVHSPVIGNPGEHNPAAGNYDYAIAARAGNPQAAVAPLNSPEVAGGPTARKSSKDADYKHPLRVRAIKKGEYNGVKEIGEEFDNTRNLAPYPEDEKSWFVPVDKSEYAAAEKRGVARREEKERMRQQEEDERAAIAKLLGARAR
jgi:hypothetical protein